MEGERGRISHRVFTLPGVEQNHWMDEWYGWDALRQPRGNTVCKAEWQNHLESREIILDKINE